jgi:ferrochelatase
MTNSTQKLILLVNLGSPAQLNVGAIRQFLRKFLADRRVVGLPKILWYPILYGIILPLRAPKLLHKYQKIWLDELNKSPLSHYTQLQAQQMAQLLNADDYAVDYAFCYGERNLIEQLAKYNNTELNQLTIIPLYPQYSSSTTAAVFDQLANYYKTSYHIPQIKFIRSYATNQLYIKMIAQQIKDHWQDHGMAERLMFSFHSIPVSLVNNGDSYIAECQQTYQLVCQELDICPQTKAVLCYQSKFGKAKWVEPATEQVIQDLAYNSVTTLDVICPGFVSDCLETLEEVAIQYRELFINNGGILNV